MYPSDVVSSDAAPAADPSTKTGGTGTNQCPAGWRKIDHLLVVAYRSIQAWRTLAQNFVGNPVAVLGVASQR